MKKSISVAIIASTLLIIPSLPRASSAAEYSVGGNIWLNWWKPPWTDYFWTIPYLGYKNPFSVVIREKSFEPRATIMAGPAFSVKFKERWGFSAVFMTGKYMFDREEWAYDVYWDEGSIFKWKREIIKFDGDANFSYHFHKYIKIFFGFKFQNYRYDETIRLYVYEFATTVFTPGQAKMKSRVGNLGAGAGLGFTIPLKGNTYILWNVSGIAIGGTDEVKVDYATNLDLLWSVSYPKGHFTAYGGSSSLAFAFYIPGPSLTVSFGARYQALYYKQSVKDRGGNPMGGRYDQFLGGTFSIIYSFGGKGKK